MRSFAVTKSGDMKKASILLVCCFLFISCQEQNKANQNKPLIVATTGILTDAIKNIVKDSAEVISIMGTGVDPHLYKASQGDLYKFLEADYIFYNGLNLEGKMADVLSKLSRTKTVIGVSDQLPKSLIITDSSFASAYDPHVWFDVDIWKEVIKIASHSLQELDTSNATYYRRNTDQYLKQLDSLSAFINYELSKIPKHRRILITAHDAFSYLGRKYDIEIRSLQGISTLSDFGLRSVSDLVNIIIEQKIPAVFIETSISDRSVKAVVEGVRKKGFPLKIGGSLYSDALGERNGPQGNYIGMVKYNIQTIVQGLKDKKDDSAS